jgi:uncharacterized protein (DUF58 family)
VAPRPTRLALTSRGSGVLVGTAVLFLLGFYTANFVVFAVAVFLFGLVAAELVLFAVGTYGFGPNGFSVERPECSSFVAVGRSGLVSVRVTSRLPGSFYAEVFDSHPDRLRPLEGTPRLLTWWRAHETVTLAYVVSPQLRGLFDIGPTVVTAHDTLGFAFKSVTLDSPWTIEAVAVPVAPDVGHPDRLPSTVVGQTWLSARGAGTEFRGLRDYQPSDELRHIAWSRSGQGRLYVREFERESQQDLLVLIDVGTQMAVGVGYEDALEKAIQAGTVALRASFEEGGRSGVVVFASDVLVYQPAGRGSLHEFRVARTLAGAQIGTAPSDLAAALGYLLPRLRRPTSLLAFSALGGDAGRLAVACGALGQAGHRLYVLAPDERAMFPPLADKDRQTAFDLLSEMDARRRQRMVDLLERSGVPVGRYGRDGAVDAVRELYTRRRLRPEAA